MQLEILTKGIYHIYGDSHYEIASTFMRMQEFYESPFRGIRNNYFTVETYMDLYAAKYGNFTYCIDWDGFNVPGNIARKFYDTFQFDLLIKEQTLLDLIKDVVDSRSKFYLIGTHQEGATFDHELAHAFYYMDPAYKKAMNVITKSLPKRIHKQLCDELTEIGYAKNVIADELQAYCSTSTMVQLTKDFKKIDIPWESILEYKKLFVEVKDNKLLGT